MDHDETYEHAFLRHQIGMSHWRTSSGQRAFAPMFGSCKRLLSCLPPIRGPGSSTRDPGEMNQQPLSDATKRARHPVPMVWDRDGRRLYLRGMELDTESGRSSPLLVEGTGPAVADPTGSYLAAIGANGKIVVGGFAGSALGASRGQPLFFVFGRAGIHRTETNARGFAGSSLCFLFFGRAGIHRTETNADQSHAAGPGGGRTHGRRGFAGSAFVLWASVVSLCFLFSVARGASRGQP